jgi:hypothetical protein
VCKRKKKDMMDIGSGVDERGAASECRSGHGTQGGK